jgi:hypothetical protein
MAVPRRRIRDAMRALEDAVVELHALEERACGRRTAREATSIERARAAYLSARGAVSALDLSGDDRLRAVALLETVGLLLALREAAGDTSIAARVLN